MPIHDLRCPACGHTASHYFRTFADAERVLTLSGTPDAPVCPRCGNRELRRIFGRFAVRRVGEPDPTSPSAIAHRARQTARESAVADTLGPRFDEALGHIAEGADPGAVMDAYEPDAAL